jgi:hypothetical protein
MSSENTRGVHLDRFGSEKTSIAQFSLSTPLGGHSARTAHAAGPTNRTNGTVGGRGQFIFACGGGALFTLYCKSALLLLSYVKWTGARVLMELETPPAAGPLASFYGTQRRRALPNRTSSPPLSGCGPLAQAKEARTKLQGTVTSVPGASSTALPSRILFSSRGAWG